MKVTNTVDLQSETVEGKVREITEKLREEVRNFFQSDRYKEYLDVVSRFHSYSSRNSLLIAMQRPDASYVAGFSSWKHNFDRHVKRGERGIRILAPAPYKVKVEREKQDENGVVIKSEDGRTVMEQVEITKPCFKVVTVFDVGQTEGKELPEIAVKLTGDVEQFRDFQKVLENVSPVSIEYIDIQGKANGYFSPAERKIAVDRSMSQLQIVKTTIHEIAHARMHDRKDPDDNKIREHPDRKTKEVEAESVAYVVCKHFGLDTSEYSFGYIAGWSSGKEIRELEGSLERIRDTASELIQDIEGNFREILQQREESREENIKQESAALSESEKEMAVWKEDIPYLLPEDYLKSDIDDMEPVVTIGLSENRLLQEGMRLPLAQADKLFRIQDQEVKEQGQWYEKVNFRIDYVFEGKSNTYEGRQDLGDGDGGLLEHIRKSQEAYLDSRWFDMIQKTDGTEAAERDRASREFVIRELLPYMYFQCNLSELKEQVVQLVKQETDGLGEAGEKDAQFQAIQKYYAAFMDYIHDCRDKVNRGDYELLPAPQIDREAASYGMTVEQYAANGYEPPADRKHQAVPETSEAIGNKDRKKAAGRKSVRRCLEENKKQLNMKQKNSDKSGTARDNIRIV